MSANPTTAGFILPLSSIDEVREELADTETRLARMGEFKIVDVARWAERRETLNRWRDRLRSQLEAMEATDAV